MGPRLQLEGLEARMVLASVGMAAGVPPVSAVVRPLIEPVTVPSRTADGGPGQAPQSWNASAPWGFDPQQLAEGYGFNAIGFGSSTGDGAGQTIAIVDAYDDPALVDRTAAGFGSSDLARFDQQFGLPDPPSFLKLNESGGTAGLPGVRPGRCRHARELGRGGVAGRGMGPRAGAGRFHRAGRMQHVQLVRPVPGATDSGRTAGGLGRVDELGVGRV